MDGGTEDRAGAVERRFDPSRVPTQSGMRALVNEVRSRILEYEAHFQLRKRVRRGRDQEYFDAQVSALVCDLVHASLSDPKQWLRISLSNEKLGRRNVGPKFMTESFRTVVEYMAARGLHWVELEKGGKSPFGRQESTIRASKTLRNRALELGVSFGDIGRDMALMGDPIVLRSQKVKGKAKDLVVPIGEPADSYRAEMHRINTWIAQADIWCDESNRLYKPVDIGDRWLRRIFNNESLAQGGRLFGGFWSGMSSEDRLKCLYINQEPVAGLDYGQCAVRIAYGMAGVTVPKGDLYSVPRLEHYRDGIKQVLNSMFFSGAPLKRKPQNSVKLLPKNYTIGEIQDRIRAHHQPISRLFHSGFGMLSQRIESSILVRCLLTLMDRGIVALPVHDCLVVPRSNAEDAKQVMLDTFLDVTGAAAEVDTKVLNHGAKRSDDF
jgi:hypothetical protein